MIDVAKMRAYIEAATPGVWVRGLRPLGEPEAVDVVGGTICEGIGWIPDAAFIVQARSDLPALLDAYEELREAAAKVVRTSGRPDECAWPQMNRLRALLEGEQ